MCCIGIGQDSLGGGSPRTGADATSETIASIANATNDAFGFGVVVLAAGSGFLRMTCRCKSWSPQSFQGKG